MATEHRCPWRLSFSYGRALQASTIKKWNGKEENVEAARAILRERCKANSEASLGKYVGKGETGPRLYVEGYIY